MNIHNIVPSFLTLIIYKWVRKATQELNIEKYKISPVRYNEKTHTYPWEKEEAQVVQIRDVSVRKNHQK